MKIKSDFITNSSSSNFIVFWPELITDTTSVSKYPINRDFIDIITKDALSQEACIADENNMKLVYKIINELTSGYYSPLEINTDYNYMAPMRNFCSKHGITEKEYRENVKWSMLRYEEENILKKQKARKIAYELIEKNKGSYIYVFAYGDEDGRIFGRLEHENDWGGLPYERISHH